jgi:S1-C subfamily serine protease
MRSRAASLLPRLAVAAARSREAAAATPATSAAAAAVAVAAFSSSSSANPQSPSSSTTLFTLFAGTAAAAAAVLSFPAPASGKAAADPQAAPSPPTTTTAASADQPPLLARLARDVEQRLSGLTTDEIATVRLFEQAAPSVVAVTNLRTFRFFRLSLEDVPVGAGSGFIFDRQGRVVTNYHVVKGATHVAVTMMDGTELKAEVLGVDPERDIAVIQLKPPAPVVEEDDDADDDDDDDDDGDDDGNNSKTPLSSRWRQQRDRSSSSSSSSSKTATKTPSPAAGALPPLTPVTLGSSSRLLVGQRVYAIGAPLGLDHTLSSGIVSALGRQIPGGDGDTIQSGIIQTDASGVNPGSSGGPLLDSRGRTVGVLCAIADPSGRGANAGISFAIPIDSVVGVVRQIIEHGRVVRPSLGVAVAPGSFARRLTGGDVEGVLLLQVPPNSPAAEAELRGCGPLPLAAGAGVVGDIIVALNGRDTPDVAELTEALDECKVGQVVEVEIARYFPPPAPADLQQERQGRRHLLGGASGSGGLAPGGEWRWATTRVKLGERGVAGSVE